MNITADSLIVIFASLAGSLVIPLFVLRNRRRTKAVKIVEAFIAIFQTSALVSAVVAAWDDPRSPMRVAERLFEIGINHVGLQITQALVVLFITALGLLAYQFKKVNQKWYGASEVIVGFLSAVAVAGTLTPNQREYAKWATLAGCAYIITRGTENYKVGKKKITDAEAASTSPQASLNLPPRTPSLSSP